MKAPIPVIIFAWLLLILGIFSLLAAGPSLAIGILGKSALFVQIGLFALIKGIILVVISFGLRKMKIWAVYVLTVLTTAALTLFVLDSFTIKFDWASFVDLMIQVVTLVYFWVIKKRFN